MGKRRASLDLVRAAAAVAVALLGLVVAASSAAEVRPPADEGTAEEVKALVAIRAALRDPDNVLSDWVANSDDPCRWRMVTCYEGLLHGLDLSYLNLSGTLSPEIGKLRRLRNLILGHNAISGPVPNTIGGLKLLQRLDLSNNQFTGTIPGTLADRSDLFYVNLSNNNLSGVIPDSLATAHSLFFIDISFNNLSGTAPIFSARGVLLDGNPLLRRRVCGGIYSSALAESLVLPVQYPRTRPKRLARSTKTTLLSVAVVFLIALFFVLVATIIWLLRKSHQIFADIDEAGNPEDYDYYEDPEVGGLGDE